MKVNRNLDEAPEDTNLVLVKTMNGKNFPYVGEKCVMKGKTQWLVNGVYGPMIREIFDEDYQPDGWVEDLQITEDGSITETS